MASTINRVLVLDTETGGLNPHRNPLLSIGLLLAEGTKVIDLLSIKCLPPKDTWLEVPIPEDQLKGKYSKKYDHWLNLTTGDTTTPVEEKPASFITAVAAEVNGFVGASETIAGWDMNAIHIWGGVSYEEAVKQIMVWLEKHPPAEAVVCHNSDFDKGFVRAWLPELMPALPLDWLCTQYLYKEKFLGGKIKGSSLSAICKVAGYDAKKEDFHTEIGDCKATHFIWNWLKANS